VSSAEEITCTCRPQRRRLGEKLRARDDPGDDDEHAKLPPAAK